MSTGANTNSNYSSPSGEVGRGVFSFDEIRPFNDDEVRPAIESLLNDRQFSRILKSVVPILPLGMSRGVLKLATMGIHSTLDFQLRFMKPVVNYVLRKCSTGHTFQHDSIKAGDDLSPILAGFKWQLTVKGGALLLALKGALTGLLNPVEMLGNELLDCLFGQSDRCRNMHIAIFGDAHG